MGVENSGLATAADAGVVVGRAGNPAFAFSFSNLSFCVVLKRN